MLKNIQEKKVIVDMSTKRIEQFDIMRLIMCLGVCWSHSIGSYVVAAPVLGDGGVPHIPWLIATFGQTFVRICVAIFFMISGTLLLNSGKNMSISFVYKNRVKKWIILLLIWSAIYYIFFCTFISGWNFSILEFCEKVLTIDITSSYWYLYALIGLQMILPLLAAITQQLDKKYLWLMVVVGIFTVYFTALIYKATDFNISGIYKLLVSNTIVIQFVLGYLLSFTEISKKIRSIIYIVGIISFCVTFYLAQGMYYAGTYSAKWFLEDSIFVLGMTVAFFVFCKHSKLMKKLSSYKVVKLGSVLSLGVYLIHQLIIKVYVEISPVHYTDINILFMGKFFLIITGVSFIIVYLMYKLPVIRKLVI